MKFDLSKPLKPLHAILLSVLVCVAAFLIALIIVSSRAVALEDALRLSATNISDVQVEGEYIYYLEAGSLHCVSVKGKFEWNTGVDRSANFHVSPYGIAVWRGSRLQIVDISNGVVVGSTGVTGDILSAVVGDVYCAAVVGPEHNSTVVFTDKYGNIVETLERFEGVTVLDCGFFEGRDLFWIMTLDASGSTPTCRISTHKPGRSKETGSITDMDQVIYKVMFRSSNICAVGTKSLNVYDYTGNQKTSESVNVYGWHLEAVDTRLENPIMVFAPNTQVGDTVAIKDLRCVRGTSDTYMHFPVPCTNICTFENTVYGFSGGYLAVGSYTGGSPNVYRLPVNVSDVLGITSERYAVVTGGSAIYVIKLPEE